MTSATKKLLIYFLLPLALLLVVVTIANIRGKPDFKLHVNFYTVDGGSSVFIKTYQGRKIIINGGSNDKILSKIGNEMPFFDRTIDLMVLTNPSNSNIPGLVSILKRYQVKKVLLPPSDFSSSSFSEFLQVVKDKGIEKIFARAGQRFWLDAGTVIDITAPTLGQSGGIESDLRFGKIQVDLNKIVSADDAIISDGVGIYKN